MKTLLAIAEERNPALRELDYIDGEQFEAVGLPILSQCSRCGETLAVYNAYMDEKGWIWCLACGPGGV